MFTGNKHEPLTGKPEIQGTRAHPWASSGSRTDAGYESHQSSSKDGTAIRGLGAWLVQGRMYLVVKNHRTKQRCESLQIH